MQAIRVYEPGEPDVMKLEDAPDPAPGPGQIVVRINAAGVNPVDTYIRAGTAGYRPRSLPYTPGIDAAGEVLAVGDEVKRFKPGDRVYVGGSISGTYAQQALCSESQVHPLPDHITFAQGAALNVPYGTAYRALVFRARAMAGERVLVHGASGGVGIAAVQFARAAGLQVIGTAGTDRGRQLVTEQGAHHVLDHASTGFGQKLIEITEGHGVDVILEMLANVNLGKDLTMLAKGGRVVVIGSRGTIEIDPRQTMSRDASIVGMSLANASEQELVAIHAAIVAGLENRTLRPVIGREFPLADASAAHHAVMQAGAGGKIVLVP